MTSGSGFQGWDAVAQEINRLIDSGTLEINEGQRSSLRALAKRLPQHGVIIADEVGMGKTRIAAVIAQAVASVGGRVAIAVPPGLGFQWRDELKKVGVEAPPMLRSFWQFLSGWEPQSGNAKSKLWQQEAVLLVSHGFANWRLGEQTQTWRWALLALLYADRCEKGMKRRPNGYAAWECENLDNKRFAAASKAAKSISDAAAGNRAASEFLDSLLDTPWGVICQAASYDKSRGLLRTHLLQAVGLGLGVFDLVIVDEAHKSRGAESQLNALLASVLWQSHQCRRLALTATPIELEADQWGQMLGRIGLGDQEASPVHLAVRHYVDAVRAIRLCPLDPKARSDFQDAARDFENKLRPYVLRRDKRSDSAVKRFVDLSREGFNAYREETEIRIETTQLSLPWKQAICAAEALSWVAQQTEHSKEQRLRLTLANGHGMTALLDAGMKDVKEDQPQLSCEQESDEGAVCSDLDAGHQTNDDKRAARINWWRSLMGRSVGSSQKPESDESESQSVLFAHPALRKAVEEVEAVTRTGEKVLVFGRFTRPLRALVQLLNAREMWRCLAAGTPWSQSRVAADQWAAVKAAHGQLLSEMDPASIAHLLTSRGVDQEALNDALDRQYRELEKARLEWRGRVTRVLKESEPDRESASAGVQAFLHALEGESGDAALNRALHEELGHEASLSWDSVSKACHRLMLAAGDNEVDAEQGASMDEDDSQGHARYEQMLELIREEHSGRDGTFARLMYGQTKPPTRRLLQLAFNRRQNRLKVLVAQSVVGREGLNLHEECRTVVLLHPEWNPGVVEQQIGRVDRIGSLWSRQLMQVDATADAVSIPRIHIRPVIFAGTYDEKAWEVLRVRWDNLRAQLHGVVIPPRLVSLYDDETQQQIEDLNRAAPSFSPDHGV